MAILNSFDEQFVNSKAFANVHMTIDANMNMSLSLLKRLKMLTKGY